MANVVPKPRRAAPWLLMAAQDCVQLIDCWGTARTGAQRPPAAVPAPRSGALDIGEVRAAICA